MGKHNTHKQVTIAKTNDLGDFREQLIHRQLQWLMFWTCVFLVAGALVGIGDSMSVKAWRADDAQKPASLQASEWTRLR